MTRSRFMWTLSLLLSTGCGELDNRALRDALVHESCAAELTIVFQTASSTELVVGVPYVFWLRTDSPASFTVEGLPDGLISLRDEIRGRATVAGSFPVVVRAERSDCPAATAELELTLTVLEPCTEDCPEIPACEHVATDSLKFQLTECIGGECLLVQNPNEVRFWPAMHVQAIITRPSGAETTHRMLLVPESTAKSPQKHELVLDYSLPGGVPVPVERELVDVSYHRGSAGDSYLFLNQSGAARFVIYDGYLDRAELASRCAESGGACPVPQYSVVPTGCSHPECDGEVLAVRVLADATDATRTTKELRHLVSGQAARRGDQLTRLVEARVGCDSEMAYRVTFYEIPIAHCSVAEARVSQFEKGATAPSQAVLSARVVFPTQWESPACRWTFDTPDPLLGLKAVPTGANLWVGLPLVGDYRARVTCDVFEVTSGKEFAACNARPAELALSVHAAAPGRVELIWHGDDVLSLLVGGAPGKKQGEATWVFALDLDAVLVAQPIEVRYDRAGLAKTTVDAVVRVMHEGKLVHRSSHSLMFGDQWLVGAYGPSGFEPQTR